ncbi:hypothetical protein [Aminobacter sp. MSH1]|uniref:hypothetical protein n=1 Tax=Aminobacter sp. MSH1 TaxID=374606 RepID=UPI00131F2668|nr:hypothetical protein [Aminobacter sp. MSH1]
MNASRAIDLLHLYRRSRPLSRERRTSEYRPRAIVIFADNHGWISIIDQAELSIRCDRIVVHRGAKRNIAADPKHVLN